MGFVADKEQPSGFVPDSELPAEKTSPVKNEPTYSDNLRRGGVELLRGLVRGGPLGLGMAGFGEGVRQGSELLSKAAYNLGGKVTDVTGSPVAGTVANVATEAVPMALGGGLGKAVTIGAERSGARSLMQSILKPQFTNLETGKADKAIETILQQKIDPSREGLAKVQARVSELNKEIEALIAKSPETVDKIAVADRLRDVASKYGKQVNPTEHREAIGKVYEEFMREWPNRIPVQLAQELKQGTYRALGERAYGELGSASQEAQKQLARGLKEEVAKKVPTVAEKNRLESELLNVITVAERRALIDGNKNPAGLGLLAKDPEMLAAFLADRSPWFKKNLAQMMYRGGYGEAAGQIMGGAAGAYTGTAP